MKKYIAATMKEAMEQAKEELGPDAVVVHSKKYKEGGTLGFRGKEMVEVTVAVEDEPETGSSPREEPVPVIKPAVSVLPKSVLSQYKTNGTERGVKIAEKAAAPIIPPSFTGLDPNALPVATSGVNKKRGTEQTPPLVEDEEEEGFTELVPEKLSSRIIKAEEFEAPKAKPKKTTSKRSRGKKKLEPEIEEDFEDEDFEDAEEESGGEQKKIQRLEAELAQMKALLVQVMSKDQPQDRVSLQEALSRQEVDKKILDDFASVSGVGDTLADKNSAVALSNLQAFLENNMKFSSGINLSKNGPKIVALLGPTGVGKTTTLAKIAARFVLEKKPNVALVTADTYRVSAVEQLKTYSDIMGLPITIVYNADNLRMAIREHGDKELILIDTAGRSQHNIEQMQELQELLKANSRIEKHLVISATTKYRDAQDIIEKFSVCKPDRIIFTKTDETNSVGLILNLLYKKKLPLSFLADGQRVPDDITPAGAKKLAELLLRD